MYNVHMDTVLVGIRYSFKFKLTSTILAAEQLMTLSVMRQLSIICGCILLSRCYRPWNLRKIRCSLSLFSVKNA